MTPKQSILKARQLGVMAFQYGVPRDPQADGGFLRLQHNTQPWLHSRLRYAWDRGYGAARSTKPNYFYVPEVDIVFEALVKSGFSEAGANEALGKTFRVGKIDFDRNRVYTPAALHGVSSYGNCGFPMDCVQITGEFSE